MNEDEQAKNIRQGVSLALQSLICLRVIEYANSIGIKQADMCRTLQSQNIKITTDILSHVKRGSYQRQLSLYTLIAICEACGLSINDIITVHAPVGK